jgi:hypothetical protein
MDKETDERIANLLADVGKRIADRIGEAPVGNV